MGWCENAFYFLPNWLAILPGVVQSLLIVSLCIALCVHDTYSNKWKTQASLASYEADCSAFADAVNSALLTHSSMRRPAPSHKERGTFRKAYILLDAFVVRVFLFSHIPSVAHLSVDLRSYALSFLYTMRDHGLIEEHELGAITSWSEYHTERHLLML